MITFFQK